MQVGYARVSTKDQNLDLQREALNKAGCEKIYEDRVSGNKTARQGLDLALEVLREGDSLVVWKLDRLGRNVKDLVSLVEQLENQGIHFKSLTDAYSGESDQRFRFYSIT